MWKKEASPVPTCILVDDGHFPICKPMLSLQKKVLLGLGFIIVLGTILNVIALGLIQVNERKQLDLKQESGDLQSYLEHVHKEAAEARLHLTNYRLTENKNEFSAAQRVIQDVKRLLQNFPESATGEEWEAMKTQLLGRQQQLVELVDGVGNSHRRAKQSRSTTNGQSEQLLATLGQARKELRHPVFSPVLNLIAELETLLQQTGTASLKLQADLTDPSLEQMLPQLPKAVTQLEQIREALGECRTKLEETAVHTQREMLALSEFNAKKAALAEKLTRAIWQAREESRKAALDIWGQATLALGTVPGVLTPSFAALWGFTPQIGTISPNPPGDSTETATEKAAPQPSKAEIATLAKLEEAKLLIASQLELFESVREVFGEYRSELQEVAATTQSYSAAVSELNTSGVAFDDAVNKAIALAQNGSGKMIPKAWEHPMVVMGVSTGVFTLFGLGAGVLISAMLAKYVRKTVGVISDSVVETLHSAHLVSSASKMLADGTSQQAAALEETSAAMEKISSMVHKNNQGTAHSKELALEARAAVEVGQTQINAMNETLSSIKNVVQEMSRAISEMQEEEIQVAEIAKDIRAVAFQTNLLALNAAIEAARAGREGLGFAVVADEVRALARRSSQAARETTDRINGSIKKSHINVQASNRLTQNIQELEINSQAVRESFARIMVKTVSVDGVIDTISTSSGEQSAGIEQVRQAIEKIDKITQSNAASSEETAAASHGLALQVEKISDAVRQLEAFAGGKSHTPPAETLTLNPPVNPSLSLGGGNPRLPS